MLKEDGGSRVCFSPEGGGGRSGVCSLFGVTVALGAHMKLEAQLLALSQVTQSLPGGLWPSSLFFFLAHAFIGSEEITGREGAPTPLMPCRVVW